MTERSRNWRQARPSPGVAASDSSVLLVRETPHILLYMIELCRITMGVRAINSAAMVVYSGMGVTTPPGRRSSAGAMPGRWEGSSASKEPAGRFVLVGSSPRPTATAIARSLRTESRSPEVVSPASNAVLPGKGWPRTTRARAYRALEISVGRIERGIEGLDGRHATVGRRGGERRDPEMVRAWLICRCDLVRECAGRSE
jgi:hypothetical protein